MARANGSPQNKVSGLSIASGSKLAPQLAQVSPTSLQAKTSAAPPAPSSASAAIGSQSWADRARAAAQRSQGLDPTASDSPTRRQERTPQTPLSEKDHVLSLSSPTPSDSSSPMTVSRGATPATGGTASNSRLETPRQNTRPSTTYAETLASPSVPKTDFRATSSSRTHSKAGGNEIRHDPRHETVSNMAHDAQYTNGTSEDSTSPNNDNNEPSKTRFLVPAAQPAVNFWSQRQAQHSADLEAVAKKSGIAMLSSGGSSSNAPLADKYTSEPSNTRSEVISVEHKTDQGSQQATVSSNNREKFPLVHEKVPESGSSSMTDGRPAVQHEAQSSNPTNETSPKGKTKWTKITPTVTHTTEPTAELRKQKENATRESVSYDNRPRDAIRAKRRGKAVSASTNDQIPSARASGTPIANNHTQYEPHDQRPSGDLLHRERSSKASASSSRSSPPLTALPNVSETNGDKFGSNEAEAHRFVYSPTMVSGVLPPLAADPGAISTAHAMSRQSSRQSDPRGSRRDRRDRKGSYGSSVSADRGSNSLRGNGRNRGKGTSFTDAVETNYERRNEGFEQRWNFAIPGYSYDRGSDDQYYERASKGNDDFAGFPIHPFSLDHFQNMIQPGGRSIYAPLPQAWRSMSESGLEALEHLSLEEPQTISNGASSIDSRPRHNGPARTRPAFPYVLQSPQEILARLQLEKAIRDQVEFYFSGANLVKDLFLRKAMDDQGFVPLPFIAQFRRMQNLTTNLELVVEVLMTSEHLTVYRPDNHGALRALVRARVDWEQWVLPPSERLDLDSMRDAALVRSNPVSHHGIGDNGNPRNIVAAAEPMNGRLNGVEAQHPAIADSPTPRRASTSALDKSSNTVQAIRMPPRRALPHLLPISDLTPAHRPPSDDLQHMHGLEQRTAVGLPVFDHKSTLHTSHVSSPIVKLKSSNSEDSGPSRALFMQPNQALPPARTAYEAHRTQSRRHSSPTKEGRVNESAVLDEDDEDPFGDNYLDEQMAGVESFVKGWGSRATSASMDATSE